MRLARKIALRVGCLLALGGIGFVAFHALGPRYKVESNGYSYRVVAKIGLSYSLIPDRSPRLSDRCVNQFDTYDEAQQLIKWLEDEDSYRSWRSVSGPVKRAENNVALDLKTAVIVPPSKCMAKTTTGFVAGETSYRDILGTTWVYTGANPEDVNDYRNWRGAVK